jgi:hypothetical protein
MDFFLLVLMVLIFVVVYATGPMLAISKMREVTWTKNWNAKSLGLFVYLLGLQIYALLVLMPNIYK